MSDRRRPVGVCAETSGWPVSDRRHTRFVEDAVHHANSRGPGSSKPTAPDHVAPKSQVSLWGVVALVYHWISRLFAHRHASSAA